MENTPSLYDTLLQVLGQLAKSFGHSHHGCRRHLFGQINPTRISHIVDVAISTIDITTAHSFYEYRIDLYHVVVLWGESY